MLRFKPNENKLKLWFSMRTWALPELSQSFPRALPLLSQSSPRTFPELYQSPHRILPDLIDFHMVYKKC